MATTRKTLEYRMLEGNNSLKNLSVNWKMTALSNPILMLTSCCQNSKPEDLKSLSYQMILEDISVTIFTSLLFGNVPNNLV